MNVETTNNITKYVIKKANKLMKSNAQLKIITTLY